MTTTEQKIEPFAYQTSTIPEVKNDLKKDGEKDSESDIKPNVNRKRSRATPEQLAILEATFEKNTSPNSKLREVLAEKVHMSERSIQIWFQNRRAKVKNTQKRNQQAAFQDQLFKSQFYLQYPGGGMYGGYQPYSQPIYQPGMPGKIINRSKSIDATNMYGQSLNTVPEGSIANPIMGGIGYATAGQTHTHTVQEIAPAPTLTPSVEKNYYNFTNKALVIGTWRRIFIPGENDSLRCCFSIVDKKIRWIIKEQNIRFKVEFPFSSIGQIVLEPYNNTVSTGKLSINLIKSPTFWMETNGPTNPVWSMSGDFTENQQASKVYKHVIEGDYTHLKVEVSSIIRSSIDLQQLCRIVSPSELLYQQQTNHFQRRQSCPAGLIFNPNNQYMTGGRRLSIPANTSLMTIPQNVVVSGGVPMVQPQMIDTTSQMLQNAAVNPLAKPSTIGNTFVTAAAAAQPLVQKMQLTSPVQQSTVTAAGATDAQLQSATAAVAVTLPTSINTNTISLSPTETTKTTIPVGASPVAPLNTATENTIQSAVPAATTTLANTNVISPLALNSTASSLTATNNLSTAQSITKSGGFIMDNLNIMNGAQLADSSTNVLNFINTESTDSTLVDNSLTSLGSNLSLTGTDASTFELNGFDEQFILNLDKNFM
ncbi:hypothetical protein BCR36DRAFT_585991 [Piromyces finnis]|uniref:Homeobox domain-containing protein n=1 Tax=Piromyces finnis TaxID=1754191 RepID=A0A1Y1V114_9FUNG|nr:hypothetical protein BCR36DRAFT_585991 [Piromyces finnis]|eukprot:ORX44887.1 hypothetical protein BCR36DRAFT_585991 [Piromyces finnis]